ncbi:MAG TPA: EAL domain-containing protein [Terriglobia bacterium]|nr:EAL domain-containing protein [Terriglobia bacterium]
MATPRDESSLSKLLSGNPRALGGSLDQLLPDFLRAVRSHLGMDVAFLSEFTDGQRVFRHVDSSLENQPVKVGGADPLEASYCQRVVDGRLPELIQDATAVPAAMELPVTRALPVGAHLSVPIKLKDGSVYGTFCCFSFTPDLSLNQRDLGMMRVFADLAADVIERNLEKGKQRDEKAKRIQSVISGDGLSIVYQPIINVAQDKVVGFESLTRFSATPLRGPDVWFNEAASVGMGAQLEMRAVELAMAALDSLPQDVYLSFNVSPEALINGDLRRVLEGMLLERLVLEITEHATIDEYSELTNALAPLRTQGLRLAVDDAGAGFASFRHILRLQPDIIKLDMSLTRDIDTDAARRALASALIRFAHETGSKIVAEGVETASELRVLRSLGVNKAQGYFLGRPAPLANALQSSRATRN